MSKRFKLSATTLQSTAAQVRGQFFCTKEVCEISGELPVIISLRKINRSNVYIVAENDLHTYVRLFKSYGLNVHRIVCARSKDFRKVDDVEIVSTQDLLTDSKNFFRHAVQRTNAN